MRVPQAVMAALLSSGPSHEGQDWSGWRLISPHGTQIVSSLLGTRHIAASALPRRQPQNGIELSVRAASGSWGFVLSVGTQKIDHLGQVYLFYWDL